MNKRRMKILLVDDSRTVRQLLKLILSKHLACDISEAEDGLDAVEKLSSHTYDLMITDINMPRMDGLALIRKVRDELFLNVPIIVVSTMGKEDDRDTGMKLGADSYVTKPIQGAHLVRTATDLVMLSRA